MSDGLTRDDLRAAVSAGIMTEAQAASVLALSEARRGVRERADGLDEPFELFKGFNEIFIVVGLVILYSGWMGITGLGAYDRVMVSGSFAIYAAVTMGALVLAARYFTLTRRMVAPSIALAVMFAMSAVQLGLSLGWALGLGFQMRAVFTLGLTTVALGVYYALFRVPFVMLLIALGVFLTSGALLVLRGAGMPDAEDLFMLTNEGPFAWLTIVLGLVGLAVALRLDMSDPHRVTRRSASGFWLHVIAAPAIVNTVALTLFEMESLGAQAVLLVFLAAMALFAVVIDRRSFLVAGVGYVVALAIVVLEGGAMVAILFLGLGLVVLGAQWERLRGWIMRGLPAFPGKERLPPWAG